MKVLRALNVLCLRLIEAALFDYFPLVVIVGALIIFAGIGTAIVLSIQWAHCVDIVRGIR